MCCQSGRCVVQQLANVRDEPSQFGIAGELIRGLHVVVALLSSTFLPSTLPPMPYSCPGRRVVIRSSQRALMAWHLSWLVGIIDVTSS